jgi:adenylate kinase family enzyme
MSFGILIIGPSGSGKSTLSAALQELYNKLDISTTLINLDFAN